VIARPDKPRPPILEPGRARLLFAGALMVGVILLAHPLGPLAAYGLGSLAALLLLALTPSRS